MTKYRNVCQSLFEAPPHQIVSQSPPSWKFTSEYAFDQVLVYKPKTYTNSRFQISSYHDFEVIQIEFQVWCAASEAWSLYGIGYIRSLLKPAPKTPHACQRHYDVASAFCPLPLASGFWHLSCTTCDAEQGEGGNHTDFNRNLFCLGLQTNRCWIRPGN